MLSFDLIVHYAPDAKIWNQTFGMSITLGVNPIKEI